MLDTLPERLTLARQQKMPHQDLLLQVLSDEVTRRDSRAVTLLSVAFTSPPLTAPA